MQLVSEREESRDMRDVVRAPEDTVRVSVSPSHNEHAPSVGRLLCLSVLLESQGRLGCTH